MNQASGKAISTCEKAIEAQASLITKLVEEGSDSSLAVQTLCMLRHTRQLLVEDEALCVRLLELRGQDSSRCA
jgi:hypothetical protein